MNVDDKTHHRSTFTEKCTFALIDLLLSLREDFFSTMLPSK